MSLTIRSSTIRFGIFMSSLIIAVILVFQLIWLRKIYHFEQKEFDHSVVKVVRGLYEDLDMKSYNVTPLNQLIEKPKPDQYLAHITLPVSLDSLTSYLQYELEDFEIFTDCHVGVYQADSAKYIYSKILTAAATKSTGPVIIPGSTANFNHLILYFPNRRQYILSHMNLWITSGVTLMLMLIFFGACLYYFYKQKFLHETQKDFLHSFTHEFKTPVSVLLLAADVLKDPNIINRPDKLATYAGIVEYQSTYLRNQIENLLRFAHTEAHQLHPRKERHNLHDLIEESIVNLTPLMNEKKAVVNFEPSAADPFLECDKDYMIIVIMNIIDNAIKYAKTPEVQIATLNTNRSISFSVKDNGIGIERTQWKRIFKKFVRIKTGEVYTAKGFGIGLSFVKAIVKAHEGNITVSSIPGKGSTFTVQIPTK